MDGLAGKIFDPDLVHKARQEEMEIVHTFNAFTFVPLSECYTATGKCQLGTRWVDVNKGDTEKPEYRSRLVAKEIKKDNRQDLFAATPPLECKKLLFSMAVTKGIGYTKDHMKGMKLDFIEVRRAYFHAQSKR